MWKSALCLLFVSHCVSFWGYKDEQGQRKHPYVLRAYVEREDRVGERTRQDEKYFDGHVSPFKREQSPGSD